MTSGNKLSPRQKMINLMYIVFLAMLAMNVSSDVLNGFKQVEDSLSHSNEGIRERNNKLYAEFAQLKAANPEKVTTWYDKAIGIRLQSDSLFRFLDELKIQIVRQADGEEGEVRSIRRRDNIEATNYIMLSPVSAKGRQLRRDIDRFREHIQTAVSGSESEVINRYLYTELPEQALSEGKSWESALFENVPVSAAVALLTKLQGDVCNAEGEALNILRQRIDEGDLRVNRINAFVIPASRNVMRGTPYSARIVLAAIDTTQMPDVYVNDRKLDNSQGYFETTATKNGVQQLEGYIEVPRGDGSRDKLPFSTSYMVSEPSATVSNTMMNVMYAGIENPVSISVPGIAAPQINATMKNGVLTRSGNNWIARPSKVGEDAVITVTAQSEGKSVVVNNTVFRVRQLPDPRPFIPFSDEKGNMRSYKGGTGIAKNTLLGAPGLRAAIDDDLLNVEFRVTGFEMIFFDSMGNAIPEISDNDRFSARQKEAMRRLNRGKRFYISRVRAVGPDGTERNLPPLEVIVN